MRVAPIMGLTLMIYRTSRELPRNLRGYALWLCLPVPHHGWVCICTLTATGAREALRWNDRQPVPRLAVQGIHTG